MSPRSDGMPLSYRREVLPEDVAFVREILDSTGFFYPDEIDIAAELVQERLATGDESGYHFIFALRGERPVGYACFGPIPGTESSFDLYWIGVHRDCRGAGIGKELLAASETAIRNMGGRRIYIETSSRPLYEPTRAFYLRCDYRQEAILTDFYHPGDSKVIYVKEISPVV